MSRARQSFVRATRALRGGGNALPYFQLEEPELNILEAGTPISRHASTKRSPQMKTYVNQHVVYIMRRLA